MADPGKEENAPSVPVYTPVGMRQLSLRPAGQKHMITILTRLMLVSALLMTSSLPATYRALIAQNQTGERLTTTDLHSWVRVSNLISALCSMVTIFCCFLLLSNLTDLIPTREGGPPVQFTQDFARRLAFVYSAATWSLSLAFLSKIAALVISSIAFDQFAAAITGLVFMFVIAVTCLAIFCSVQCRSNSVVQIDTGARAVDSKGTWLYDNPLLSRFRQKQ